MIYSKRIKYTTDYSIEYAVSRLKAVTNPYCQNFNDKADFIGSVTEQSFALKSNQSVGFRLFSSKINGKIENEGSSAVVNIDLKLSDFALALLIIMNSVFLIDFLFFLVFYISKFYIPLLVSVFGNLILLFFIRTDFTTAQVLFDRLYSDKGK